MALVMCVGVASDGYISLVFSWVWAYPVAISKQGFDTRTLRGCCAVSEAQQKLSNRLQPLEEEERKQKGGNFDEFK